MFTGLIENQGRVVSTMPFVIEFTSDAMTLKPGDSVSVNGVCLTAINPTRTQCRFDLSPETLKLTTLGSLDLGEVVNLEPALMASSRLGGHIVQGHIDGTGIVRRLESLGEFTRLEIEIPKDLRRYLVSKGSITVDGVSLTINAKTPEGIELMIIPHTRHKTTINQYTPGRRVNLEVDVLGKYIVQYMEQNENIHHPSTH